MKQVLKSGDEQDAVSRYARSVHTWAKGALRKIKRRLNKRLRKEGKEYVKSQIQD